MQLFYHPDITDQELVLSKEESRHLIQVLRKKTGDEVVFTDGKGGKFILSIVDAHPKKAVLNVLSKELVENKKPNLSIGIAPTKNMDRLEWFLEKATEIGVSAIFPFVSKHSERKVIKEERLHKIVIGAMKQSLRYTKPEIHSLQSIDELLKMDFNGDKFLCHQHSSLHLADGIKTNNDLLILIGPEGDFSQDEMGLAVERKFKKVLIAEHRLRTETAGIVACQIVNQSMR